MHTYKFGFGLQVRHLQVVLDAEVAQVHRQPSNLLLQIQVLLVEIGLFLLKLAQLALLTRDLRAQFLYLLFQFFVLEAHLAAVLALITQVLMVRGGDDLARYLAPAASLVSTPVILAAQGVLCLPSLSLAVVAQLELLLVV